MSIVNDLSDTEAPKLRMKPAVHRIFCCSVTAASGFIAAYALVAYAIALIYEIVWVVESQSGLPVASVLLMVCYSIVIAATVTLVHGLISKNNTLLLSWLIAVILVLIPECALVFYMSISHWGLQGVYGGAELACYVARLPAIVCGVVLVQSAYALREARQAEYGTAAVSGSEFDASHYVPDAPSAFANDGFLADNGKSGSMPDLRRHLASRQSMVYPQLMPPPAYWQPAGSLRGFPKAYPMAQPYGTWVGPRSGPYENPYKRRHSIVGAFADEYPPKVYEYEDRADCKSEIAYPYYRQWAYDPRMFPPDYDPRFFQEYKREDMYGANMLRHDPYRFSDRGFYGSRNSHNSVGNESDDLTKYKDVAL
ncbi:uncharacterized protein LOC121728062 isoform X2 [Aricia agestis]|uniref:uncharacterized protein LOC121728062 isoform X1 n=1 Tax=Aricia agestis TaxID=91739 RepID=UPI001C206871|nr:uncharacterized protein LOC121728062 isoform X1 [Aricia agestis]XP_041972102.1 uncharacterized protein LOC121728062 isoform X2 [Aricia agestis]